MAVSVNTGQGHSYGKAETRRQQTTVQLEEQLVH